MAAKKRKSPDEESVGPDSLVGQWFENPSLQLMGRILVRLSLVVGIAALTYLSLEVEKEVHEDPRFQLRHWTFEFGEYPDWVSPRIREEIESVRYNGLVGPGAGEGHIFQENLLARLRERLEENPWIHEVRNLEIRFPGVDATGEILGGGLRIDMRLRRPIATVRIHGSHHYTDSEGICLGGEVPPSELDRREPLPVITGGEAFLRGLTPPGPGEPWKVPQIMEGIEVAHIIDERKINARFPLNPVIEIDIANVGGRLREDGSEILIVAHARPDPIVMGWGRSPISPRPRTSSLAETLDKLEWILQNPQRDLGQTTTRDTLLRLDLPGMNYLRVTHPGSAPDGESTSL